MKKFAIVLAGTVMLAACGGEKDKSADVELKSEDQKASYALGFRSAEQMSAMENLDLDAMVAGLRDGFGDEPESRLGEDADMDQLIRDYQTRMMEARQKKMEEQAQANLEEGQEFLDENADKDGVEVTDSGLQYQVLESGDEGAQSPTLEDTVEVHYKGMLRDGTVFDSSIERDKPAVFGLKHIIPGWQEALPMMKVGDKWKLFLPPELGYGEQGAGGDIGPNEVLIFEVELLDVKDQGDKEKQAEEGADAAE
ncbi:MAG: FKBP-type peptidyl-prolyl cis-trans isomerase [Alloalcanivorax venustensis]|mgnify:FL=1|jgi:FKBP-type peptidyl-prolyl cis-trans isomerase FklB|uniref:FKBP-type peptidyl-prolyl cis-trans isomerase n=1 Tax=Alloalcanivorax venustensis TaxID=172371 RepID=UPI000C8A6A1E|nr:peptidylprolyl isomerase [Alcanivorax sp.]MEA3261382.1 FKBP-type peptidyl-prolyl cis-trans isomerase [Pseudomonadota bacterium]SMO37283.1 FKBP-type peptidyl-prolyl cis-trans isomerase FklB [Alcanivorax sp. DSM 26295]MAK21858.1 peptidylprolyl isomerase [Alcanivorax sp.]MCH2553567.1 FKBP-type peptidyl-prolyl cis-trans isomerase [Alcanivorax sp.]|tara:strand:+ start:101582 stop:102340 length:759 start_codon:yes stop_codon:yes gene_type:complete